MVKSIKNAYFPEIKGQFAFGCLRLPVVNNEVDINQFTQMIDIFLESGFNYFDTAHGYLDGKSELALAEVLVKRYPRENYLIANKLTDSFFEKQDDIIPFFNKQLKRCGGLNYFDFYLMHDQESRNYDKFQKCHAYEIALELKNKGLIKHLGFSFHDDPELLEKILNDHPQVEFVQLQFNYFDYNSDNVQSSKLYEICKKHNKPVFVMEPVKGGRLSLLPKSIETIFNSLNNKDASYASYAIRFCLGFSNNALILSGVSDISQMKDNCRLFNNFVPLNEVEKNAIKDAVNEFKKLKIIPCGQCYYCTTHQKCPKNINISGIFSCYNDKKMLRNWKNDYLHLINSGSGFASLCIECGKCKKECPQHLNIPLLLKHVANELEV